MSDTSPTRRADEPPARDGAPLAGWPTTITAEEAVALQKALKQLQTALDAVVRERDEARAEVERLRAENERLRAKDTKTRRALKSWVWVPPDGGDEPTHERVAAVVAEVERLTRERDEARSKETDYHEGLYEGWNAAQEAAAVENERLLIDNNALRAEIERLTRERDEARAEVERLLLGLELLASHQGSLEREWHNVGAWLYAGDSINVVRAPLPEIETKP